ncbi:MAG TPA: DUF1003 domain-containing protein [Chloroflexota bacterium]
MPDELSTPRGVRRPTYNPDAFGRFSETIARYLGTGRYLAIQTVLVVIWITINVVAVALRFDPYPFILLNLLFSTQAAYAAPLILLAQNRQTERDRLQAERDREMNARSVAAMDFLAREIAAIRISLDNKVDRDDLDDAVNRILNALDHLREYREQPDAASMFEDDISRVGRPDR